MPSLATRRRARPLIKQAQRAGPFDAHRIGRETGPRRLANRFSRITHRPSVPAGFTSPARPGPSVRALNGGTLAPVLPATSPRRTQLGVHRVSGMSRGPSAGSSTGLHDFRRTSRPDKSPKPTWAPTWPASQTARTKLAQAADTLNRNCPQPPTARP